MLNVLNVCDTPIAFYFPRQSGVINSFLGSRFWRHYYDDYQRSGCQHFHDLGSFSTRDEVMSVLEESDCYIFHATRNYRRPLYCRDGVIRTCEYPEGKTEFVLIHGQPETLPLHIDRTNLFIRRHAAHVRFLVSTPNQLDLFAGTQLLPIVGQFRATDTAYQPRQDYLVPSEHVRIIRRSEWKAATVSRLLLKELGMGHLLPRQTIMRRLILSARRLVWEVDQNPLPQEEFATAKPGRQITLDNRTYWQDLFDVLKDLRASDVLLENEWGDYPGGGCNNVVGMEAMSLGVACFNGMTRANANRLSEWLGADCLPPLPNWENEVCYRKGFMRYLRNLTCDEEFRLEVKRASRQFFVNWLDAPNVVPRIIRQLEAAS